MVRVGELDRVGHCRPPGVEPGCGAEFRIVSWRVRHISLRVEVDQRDQPLRVVLVTVERPCAGAGAALPDGEDGGCGALADRAALMKGAERVEGPHRRL